MTLDPAILQRLAVRVEVTGYVRISARVHAATPLGMGYGRSRFSSRGIDFSCCIWRKIR